MLVGVALEDAEGQEGVWVFDARLDGEDLQALDGLAVNLAEGQAYDVAGLVAAQRRVAEAPVQFFVEGRGDVG